MMETNTGSKALTERMRDATKAEHEKSDKIVNLKLALVVTSPSLYGEALSLFVPIFAKIEDILNDSKHPQVCKLKPLLEKIKRTPGARADMTYYLTSERRQQLEESWNANSGACSEYLKHLEWIEANDPVLIIAYMYHLYAGVLAGGQIIKRIVKKAMGLKKSGEEGVEIFCLPDETIAKLFFKEYKKIFNEDLDLTEEEEVRIIKEGNEVFRLNNTLIETIKGTEAWAIAAQKCFNWVAYPIALTVIGLVVYFGRGYERRAKT